MSIYQKPQDKRDLEMRLAKTQFIEAMKHSVDGNLWRSYENMLRLELDELTIALANGNLSFDQIRFMQGQINQIVKALDTRDEILSNNQHPVR